ncbi:hypothetical protein [Pontibacter pudoricolor]|uniref:hypothetical protein n=1 Tax=Pontibacter pudoricolor TaxID=2694930 RepID=UPI001390AA1C|nr:hypothetical protein [Pontibacter pudoricolor]
MQHWPPGKRTPDPGEILHVIIATNNIRFAYPAKRFYQHKNLATTAPIAGLYAIVAAL